MMILKVTKKQSFTFYSKSIFFFFFFFFFLNETLMLVFAELAIFHSI